MRTIMSVPPDFTIISARVDELSARSAHLVRRISGQDSASTPPAERAACAREFMAIEAELAPLRAKLNEMVATLA